MAFDDGVADAGQVLDRLLGRFPGGDTAPAASAASTNRTIATSMSSRFRRTAPNSRRMMPMGTTMTGTWLSAR